MENHPLEAAPDNVVSNPASMLFNIKTSPDDAVMFSGITRQSGRGESGFAMVTVKQHR